MKLLFFSTSLQCGGAERVAALLCNHWADHGWDVTLATFDDGEEPPFYRVGPRVRHVPLGLQRRSVGFVSAILNNVRRLRRLRRFVADERPDRIVSFIDTNNVLALLSARGRGIPVVVSERTDPAQHSIPAAWRALRRLVYPHASAIVVQTQGARSFFPASWQPRIAIIPNPALPPPPHDRAAPAERRLAVAMGRLSPEKGFDLLIHAFASVARHLPQWDLAILGDGPERETLSAALEREGLAGRASLAGRVADPTAVLSRADLFVLSSRYEGFPNALCEAMAMGLPVVAFDCPSGPSEIVRDGIDGLLVPPQDVDALAAAIASLAADPERRRALGGRAAEITERYSMTAIAARWDEVLARRAPGES